MTTSWTAKGTGYNSGFALWGLTCFVETFLQGSTFELRMNNRAKNPPQRKAAKRYERAKTDSTPNLNTIINLALKQVIL